MNPRVRSVKPLADYKLQLEFTNGEVRVYDCRPLLDRGVVQELKNPNYFEQVRVFLGSVAWPHKQDVCPDTLYLASESDSSLINQFSPPSPTPAASPI